MIDINREVARLCDQDGQLRPTIEELCSKPHFRLTAVLQAAIEHVLSHEHVRSQMKADPRRHQAVVDTIYFVSRTWERGQPRIAIDETSLAEHLLARLLQRPGVVLSQQARDSQTINSGNKPSPDARHAIKEKLGAELDFLLDLACQLAELLCDFNALKSRLSLTEELYGRAASGRPVPHRPWSRTTPVLRQLRPI